MLNQIGKSAKEASYVLNNISTTKKDEALTKIAELLIEKTDEILLANEKDLENAKQKGISGALLDRLTLTKERIGQIAKSVLEISKLPDPIDEVISMVKRPNGLVIGKKRVPLGVIAIIYEARPNVTVEAACLCLKSSNAVILRGGSEAINSNIKLCEIMQKALIDSGLPKECINIVPDTSREIALALMKLNEYVDVIIPRGGAGLIKTCIENATVPVIETGTGNCHIYVDDECDQEMALDILINAKTSRPGVCNAAEKLLINNKIKYEFLPKAYKALKEKNVVMVGCEETRRILPDIEPATEEDWYTEYLDYKIAIKVVSDIDEAIKHINKYNSKHSEAIITTSYEKAQKFHQEVDAACVYVNASTRFTDGFEFGYGGEIGISTQKIHARGPMGLKELTSIKYIIFGNGQIR